MDSRLTDENFKAMIARWGCPLRLRINKMLLIQATGVVSNNRCDTEIVADLESDFTTPDNNCGLPWIAEYKKGCIKGDGSNF